MADPPKTNPRRPLVLLTIVGLPLALWFALDRFWFDAANRSITVTGTVQAREIPLASKVGGRLSRVYVAEGDRVKAGDVVVEFELPELDAKRSQMAAMVGRNEATLLELRNGTRVEEIQQAAARADAARARYDMLRRGYRSEDVQRATDQRQEAEALLKLHLAGSRKEEIEHAKNSMEQAKLHAAFLKKDYERYSDLAAQGAVSSREAEQLKNQWQQAEAAYQAAQATYDKVKTGFRHEEVAAARERLEAARRQESIMKSGPRTEEISEAGKEYEQALAQLTLLRKGARTEAIRRAEAELQHARAQLAEVDAQLGERKIKAPADAEVSVMDLHAGEVIAAGKTLAILTRLDDLWTRVYIPERQLARVRVGQKLSVRADAFPGKEFKGTIVQIPAQAEFTPRNVQTPEERSNQVFAIKIRIDNPDFLLRGGMNAEVALPPAGSRQSVAEQPEKQGE